jgi:hypothetical protein
MCISCGCKRYEESHGDERNITVASLQRAADASEKTMDEVLTAMAAGCRDLAANGVPDHQQSTGQAVIGRLE